jgi:hypothetical protein
VPGEDDFELVQMPNNFEGAVDAGVVRDAESFQICELAPRLWDRPEKSIVSDRDVRKAFHLADRRRQGAFEIVEMKIEFRLCAVLFVEVEELAKYIR